MLAKGLAMSVAPRPPLWDFAKILLSAKLGRGARLARPDPARGGFAWGWMDDRPPTIDHGPRTIDHTGWPSSIVRGLIS